MKNPVDHHPQWPSPSDVERSPGVEATHKFLHENSKPGDIIKASRPSAGALQAKSDGLKSRFLAFFT